MVIITNKNLKKYIEHLEKVIVDADFISFDLEVSGTNRDEMNIYLDDSLQTRYSKIMKLAKLYDICQLGFTMFRYNKSSNTYSYDTYSFYVLKHPISKLNNDICFKVNTMIFLKKYKFSFDKMVEDGIPFITLSEYSMLKNPTETIVEQLFDSMSANLKTTIVRYYGEAYFNIKQWLTSNKETNYKLDFIENSLFLYIICCWLMEDFESTFSITLTKNYQVHLIKCKEVSTNSKSFLESISKICDKMSPLSVLFDLIIKHNKLLIGHNCFMDLLFIYQNFIDELPDSFSMFSKRFSSMFSDFYDTKLIFENNFKKIFHKDYSSMFYNLFKIKEILDHKDFKDQILFWPNIQPSQSVHNDDRNVLNYHDAGYDSYITGIVFIKIGHYAAYKCSIHKMSFDLLDYLEIFHDLRCFVHAPRFCDSKIHIVYNEHNVDVVTQHTYNYLIKLYPKQRKKLTKREIYVEFSALTRCIDIKILNDSDAIVTCYCDPTLVQTKIRNGRFVCSQMETNKPCNSIQMISKPIYSLIYSKIARLSFLSLICLLFFKYKGTVRHFI